MAGVAFQTIADALGTGIGSSVTDAIMGALRDTTPKELADEVRRMENARLDALWRPMYLRAIGGDYIAVDRCLRIMARRAALNGLDAPIRVRQAVITEEDIDAVIARLDRETEAMEEAISAGDGAEMPSVGVTPPRR